MSYATTPQAGRLHPVEPPRQSVSRWSKRAQPSCPTHRQRRKYSTLSLNGRNPRGRNRRFHPVVLPAKPCKAPEVEAHASAGDRVKISALRHMFELATRTIREALGMGLYVLGVTAIQEGGQVQVRPWPTR